MSDATASEIHCPECFRAIPAAADYCPYCGRIARAVQTADLQDYRSNRPTDDDDVRETNPDGAGETDGFELEPSVEAFQRERRIAGVIFAGFLLGGALLGWLTFGDPLGESDAAGAEAVRAASAAGAAGVRTAVDRAESQVEENRPAVGRFSYRVGSDEQIGHQTSVVRHDGDRLLRLYTPKESGFSNLEARTRSVMMRIEWGAQRHVRAQRDSASAGVKVRDRGGSSEIVWSDGESSYRLLQITHEDVRHWNQRPEPDLTRDELAESVAGDLERLYDRIARAETGV